MDIGFTGTRKGMTTAQKQSVSDYIKSLSLDAAHMGDCIGADADFYEIIRQHGDIRTVGHIPDNDSLRTRLVYDEEMPPQPYLKRNQDIVDDSDILIATPDSYTEVSRSGTWATIRYAKKRGIPVVIVNPDGSVV